MLKNYVAFDLETTGLSCDTDEILEIGALKVRDGKIVERFNQLVHPKKAILPQVSELTGITNEMVHHAPEVSQVIPEFLAFCEEDVVIGHNVMFDFRFTKTFAKRQGLSFEHQGLDTLKIARVVHKDFASKSLGALCEYYGIINESAHRAYHDALATAKLYQILAHHFEVDYPEIFTPAPLIFKPKKNQPVSEKQKEYLMKLIKYHKIDFNSNLEEMTKSEASRAIDRIILQYGKL